MIQEEATIRQYYRSNNLLYISGSLMTADGVLTLSEVKGTTSSRIVQEPVKRYTNLLGEIQPMQYKTIPEQQLPIPEDLLAGQFLKGLLRDYCDDLVYWMGEGRQSSGTFVIEYDTDDGWSAELDINDARERQVVEESVEEDSDRYYDDPE